MLRAVEAAARRGATVRVELQAHPFNDRKGALAKENARLANALRADGANTSLADSVHAKEITAGDSLFLDEKNWHDGDVVLCEDDPIEARSIPMMKRDALGQEAKLLADARASDGVIVETESFGNGNPTYEALRALGEAHASPRLLVSKNDLRGTHKERSVLRGLVRCGVRVRVCTDSAKLAIAGDSAWLGSANATYAGGGFNLTDWGVCTNDATIAKTVRNRLEAEWRSAKPL